MKHRKLFSTLLHVPLIILLLVSNGFANQLVLLNDLVLDENALLMPSNATYGRAINGVSFQTEPILSFNGYQYTTWYHNDSDESMFVARRDLAGNTWEVFDTGVGLDNGAAPSWNAHNVTSMGISGDGRLHFAWDMHGNTLRFTDSVPGVATNPGGTWDATILNGERSSLNPGGPTINTVTYTRFNTDPNTGNIVLTYRSGGSGAGNMNLATYDASTGQWNTPHQFINGTNPIFYNDPYGSGSNNRNAYLNGLDIDSTGRLHTTWTWRETATGTSNHSIMYAYSDDGGETWRNNVGDVVGTVGNPIDLNSPGITVVPMDRGNTLMNQQAQTVDLDNRVHTVMWHKRDDAPPLTGFSTGPAAYFHYFRDPASGDWNRTELPTTRDVGSRPDMAYDQHGNLYVVYVSPSEGDPGGYYTSGDLIVASASKATGYQDWDIVYTDTRNFSGEPFVDLNRLVNDGVVSVFAQENSPNTGRTGTPLHVLEFDKLANKVVWTGDDTGNWAVGVGTDWDNDNNSVGDQVFADGYRVTFDNRAASFAVNIAGPVAPASTTFSNSSANSYSFTGAGIGGPGPVRVNGGGTVTLAGAANTYAGETQVENGMLVLSGSATLPNTPSIHVHAGATMDVAGLSGGLPLNAQTLSINGEFHGDVVATNDSEVHVNSSNSLNGNVTAQSGSLVTGTGKIAGNLLVEDAVVRVGGSGLPNAIAPATLLVDDFSSTNLSAYHQTRVNDSDTATNVSFASDTGALEASYFGFGSGNHEQVVFMRDDFTLAVGETLVVDVDMSSSSQQMDFGLAISETATPTGANSENSDTRDTFEWASVSVRPSQNSIRVNRSVDGGVDTTTGAIGDVPPSSISALYITRNSDTQFTVGYTDGNQVDVDASVINFTAAEIASAIGFYADLRSTGSLGSFDNLRITTINDSLLGESLLVEGDVLLGAGAILEFDVYSPSVGDVLEIGGHFEAGGLLAVALDGEAPTPALGDQFNILSFETASSMFEAFQLPPLDEGLAWNVSRLLTDGTLEVVVNVDLNGDGIVDGSDFLLIQRENPSLISAWQSLFGSQLVVPQSATATTVPEPSAWALLSFGTLVVTLGRRPLSRGR